MSIPRKWILQEGAQIIVAFVCQEPPFSTALLYLELLFAALSVLSQCFFHCLSSLMELRVCHGVKRGFGTFSIKSAVF
jgi:hypothetical protein